MTGHFELVMKVAMAFSFIALIICITVGRCDSGDNR